MLRMVRQTLFRETSQLRTQEQVEIYSQSSAWGGWVSWNRKLLRVDIKARHIPAESG
jgi:hypothetical protein